MISVAVTPLFNCIGLSRVLLITTVFIILAFTSSFATSPSNIGQEAEALLEWKASLDNQSQFQLSSWVGNITCQWVGISCNNFSSVSHISLTGSALKGTLHTLSFSCLHSLVSLDLSNNLLYGTIPSHLGNLSKLIYLNLSANQLYGRIPSEICQLTSLKILDLHANYLNGSIPRQVGNLYLLNELSLCCNNLAGSIPVSIENFRNLIILDLSVNNLSGSIPEIGMLGSLAFLNLGKNNLSGLIPTSIGNLGNLIYL